MFELLTSTILPFSSAENEDGTAKTVTLSDSRIVSWIMFGAGYFLRPTIQRVVASVGI